MVRETRMQVRGVFLLADQANRDFIVSFAKQDPTREVTVYRDRKTKQLRVSICGSKPRCIRKGMELMRRVMSCCTEAKAAR